MSRKRRLRKVWLILTLVLIIINLFCGLAFSDSSLQENTQFYAEHSIFWDSVRVIFSLIVVVGVIYLFVYLLKKFSPNSGRFSNPGKDIFSIVGQLRLSTKKSIYLVRIGERLLVLGVNGGIHLLCVIKDEKTVKSLQFPSGKPLNTIKFSEQIKKLLPSKSRETAQFFYNQIEKLKSKQNEAG